MDTSHPDLAGTMPDGRPKIAATWSTFSDDANVTDEVGHGTATASLAGALTNNGVGIAGVSPGSQLHALAWHRQPEKPILATASMWRTTSTIKAKHWCGVLTPIVTCTSAGLWICMT